MTPETGAPRVGKGFPACSDESCFRACVASGDDEPVANLELVQTLPTSFKLSITFLDGKQGMVVGPSNALPCFCDYLHRWLVVIHMEPVRPVPMATSEAR